MILLWYDFMNYGGSETLLFREGEYLLAEGHDVSILCKTVMDKTRKLFSDKKINIIVEDKYTNYKELFQNCSVILTLETDNFLRAKQIISKYGVKSKVYLYITHPYYLTNWFYFDLLDLFLKKRLKDIFYQDIIDGNIFFMDLKTRDTTLNYYDDTSIADSCIIKYLPMKIEHVDFFNTRKIKNGKFNILTIARSEFPFKGYMKGLMRDIANSEMDLEKIKLTIISHGPHIDELKKCIDVYRDRLQIELLEGVGYDQLSAYYSNSSIYIGMGTTVLEASNHGVISIPVKSYTEEFFASHYFFQEPGLISCLDETPGIKLIEEVYNLPENDYLSLCKESKKVFDLNYNASSLSNYIINTNNVLNPLDPLSILLLNLRRRKIRIKSKVISVIRSLIR